MPARRKIGRGLLDDLKRGVGSVARSGVNAGADYLLKRLGVGMKRKAPVRRRAPARRGRGFIGDLARQGIGGLANYGLNSLGLGLPRMRKVKARPRGLKLVKGSAEAKAHMARLRAMKRGGSFRAAGY